MNDKNIWPMVKSRYRLSAKIQMTFELSFPEIKVGKCRFSFNTAHDIRRKKVSPSLKGIIFSDTIPLGWFTSSVLIPWEKVEKITISKAMPPIDGEQADDSEYAALEMNDPGEMRIDMPWSKAFTDYVKGNRLFEI